MIIKLSNWKYNKFRIEGNYKLVTSLMGLSVVNLSTLNSEMLLNIKPVANFYFTLNLIFGIGFIIYSRALLRDLMKSEKYIDYVKDGIIDIERVAMLTLKSQKSIRKDLESQVELGVMPFGKFNKSLSKFYVSPKLMEEEDQIEYGTEDMNKEQLDKINNIEENLNIIRDIRVNHISEDKISYENICDIENTVKSVIKRLKDEPELIEKTNKFQSYLLPETVEFLKKLSELYKDKNPVKTKENTIKTLEGHIKYIDETFKVFLDQLHFDMSIDIESDIDVMKTVIVQEGLSNKDIIYGK